MQPHQIQELLYPIVAISAFLSRQIQGIGNITGGSTRIQQVSRLEHHADRPARLTQMLFRKGGKILPRHQDFPRSRMLQGG